LFNYTFIFSFLAKTWQSFQKPLGKILAWECIGVLVLSEVQDLLVLDYEKIILNNLSY